MFIILMSHGSLIAISMTQKQRLIQLVLMLFSPLPPLVANFDPSTFSVMRCEFCSAGFDTRAGLSSHARAHLRDFGITNWEVTVSPINILRELFAKHPDLVLPTATTHTLQSDQEQNSDEEQESGKHMKDEENMTAEPPTLSSDSPKLRWKEEHSISELEGKWMGFTSV